ncbi:MAG: hypothetical protein V3U03_00355 [Myxococcota bacterium]
MVTVRLPAVLAQLVDGERSFQVRGDTIGQALDDLIRLRPSLASHLFDDAGAMRRYIRCFHGDAYASVHAGLDRPVQAGDTITILNSVAGG